VKEITDDDLVSIAPAGHVHNQIYSEQYYLAAIAEDSWLERKSIAQRIADRIGDTRTHYTNNTILENAGDILDEHEMYREKEIAAYKAIFDNDELDRLTDLSIARNKLSRFESETVSGAWRGANKRLQIGSVHERVVSNTTDFGVFVEIEPNLDGLVQSSRLPVNFRTDDTFRRGQPILVSIVKVNRVERRIELDWVRQRAM
jgi:exoribonuclease R